jgi:hypothetical protein
LYDAGVQSSAQICTHSNCVVEAAAVTEAVVTETVMERKLSLRIEPSSPSWVRYLAVNSYGICGSMAGATALTWTKRLELPVSLHVVLY